jgi:hypothetical protein
VVGGSGAAELDGGGRVGTARSLRGPVGGCGGDGRWLGGVRRRAGAARGEAEVGGLRRAGVGPCRLPRCWLGSRRCESVGHGPRGKGKLLDRVGNALENGTVSVLCRLQGLLHTRPFGAVPLVDLEEKSVLELHHAS